MNLKVAKALFDGVYEEELEHLKDVSTYNHNYYSFNGKLLLGVSDDDNFTQWYWVLGVQGVLPIGGSYCSDNDQIIVDEAYT